MDNLSTHRQKALTTCLGPKRGANLWKRFQVHYTPKHASWLNRAEIEISMFSRQCLGRDRIATIATVETRAAVWEERVNREKVKIRWSFTAEKSRSTFKYDLAKSIEKEHWTLWFSPVVSSFGQQTHHNPGFCLLDGSTDATAEVGASPSPSPVQRMASMR